MQEKLRELILKSEPTVVYSGKGAKDMPSLEAVK